MDEQRGDGAILTILLLVPGFIVLIKGADWLVDGSSSLARQFGVSDLIIGLTIVSFGTSAPELLVSVVSAVRGNTGLAIGNILGSNVANILLILGTAAVINPVQASHGTVTKEIPFCLLAAILVGILPNDGPLEGAGRSAITRIDGIVLLLFLSVFMYYVFEAARNQMAQILPTPDVEYRKPSMSIAMTVVGALGLALGGELTVRGAVDLANRFELSEEFIGLTVLAIGTSLPELATSAVAAYRKNSDIAVGNVVGSNIFNVFLVLGVSSVISPLPLDRNANVDVIFMIATTVLLFAAMFVGKPRFRVGRLEGLFFLCVYFSYMVFLIIRG